MCRTPKTPAAEPAAEPATEAAATEAPVPTSSTLLHDLDVLHASYVSAINHAIETGRDDDAAELAASYDREATLMVAQREGRTDLLPLRRRRAA